MFFQLWYCWQSPHVLLWKSSLGQQRSRKHAQKSYIVLKKRGDDVCFMLPTYAIFRINIQWCYLWTCCGSRCCVGVRRRWTRRPTAVPRTAVTPFRLQHTRCLPAPGATWRVSARSTGARSWSALSPPIVCRGYRGCTAITIHYRHLRPGPTEM